jgi:hypothetical protein
MIGSFSRVARRNVSASLIVVVLSALGPAPTAALAEEPRNPLTDAEASYAFEDYHRALNLLVDLEQNEELAPAIRFELLLLKGRCLVRLSQNELAAEAFCGAHAINRDWQPNVETIPTDEAVAFASAMDSCQRPTAWWKRPVVWLLGGGVAAVLLIIDPPPPTETPDLPGPPAPPGAR